MSRKKAYVEDPLQKATREMLVSARDYINQCQERPRDVLDATAWLQTVLHARKRLEAAHYELDRIFMGRDNA